MTLIEVMIVVVILGLIAGAVALNVFKQNAKAQITMSSTGAKTLRSAALMWRTENPGAECPTPERLVEAQLLDSSSKLSDAWNTPYQITCEDSETVVRSLGPDRKESEDDLVVPQSAAHASE
jgi:general secretion pathway protein G